MESKKTVDVYICTYKDLLKNFILLQEQYSIQKFVINSPYLLIIVKVLNKEIYKIFVVA